MKNLVEIGAVLGGERDADTGVGGHLVAQTIVGRSNRIQSPYGEVGNLIRIFHTDFDDGKLIAAEPGDEIAAFDKRQDAGRPTSTVRRRSYGRASR